MPLSVGLLLFSACTPTIQRTRFQDPRVRMGEIAFPGWTMLSPEGYRIAASGRLLLRDGGGGTLLFRVELPAGADRGQPGKVRYTLAPECYAVDVANLKVRGADAAEWKKAKTMGDLEKEQSRELHKPGELAEASFSGSEEFTYKGHRYRRKGEKWLYVLLSPGEKWMAFQSKTQRRGWGIHTMGYGRVKTEQFLDVHETATGKPMLSLYIFTDGELGSGPYYWAGERLLVWELIGNHRRVLLAWML